MRIIAGKFGGHRLEPPKDNSTRPTTDRVKESMFSIIQNSYPQILQDAVVLDLFAGTGALGLEAVSRGAKSCRFVENNRAASKLITSNIASLKLEEQCIVDTGDATRFGKQGRGATYDLVFLDPPYGKAKGEMVLNNLIQNALLKTECLVVLEEDANTETDIPPAMTKKDERRYGDTKLLFLTCQ